MGEVPLASAPDADAAGGQPPALQPAAAGAWPVLAIGSGVRLVSRPRYLRTADPMPMLRPPDLVAGDEVGLVVEQRPLDLLAVRFRRGTFLLNRADLEPAAISD